MHRTETFPATTDSPAAARSFIRAELVECGEDAVKAAELMIGELVTNVIVHAATTIEIELDHDNDTIRAAVSDASPRLPVPLRPQESDPHGRGLLIVRSLARDWGVLVDESGKSVWFTLPCR